MISLYDTSGNITDLDEKKPSVSAFKFIVGTVQLTTFILLSAFFFGVGTYVIMSYSTYIDYQNNCYIKIEKDILSGNRETIFKALKSIRNNNTDLYKDVCGYVDTVAEATCLVGDPMSPKLQELNTDGCYVKGTKTIFIKPDNSDHENAVTIRIGQILKYTQKSKEYWVTH